MNTFTFTRCAVVTLGVACLGLLSGRAEESTSRIKFSDPGKPGTLKIIMARGDLRITGADTNEVAIGSQSQPRGTKQKDGLRVLTEAASFSLTEKDNVVTLDAAGDGWAGAPSDFRITVPRATTIVVASSFGGDVACGGVTGDIEIKSMQGDVQLADVTGGALVETMSGNVNATFRELRDGKAVSFTSMNGRVMLRLPADAKANVRLRTQNGTIATDFDEKALVTKVESVAGGMQRRTTGALSAEAREAFRQAARAGAEAANRAAEAVREAAEAAREGAEADSDVARTHRGASPVPPMPPRPPVLPAIPAVTGGKLVTGTLNGGGPEIAVATMNGDVTLRRIDGKPATSSGSTP